MFFFFAGAICGAISLSRFKKCTNLEKATDDELNYAIHNNYNWRYFRTFRDIKNGTETVTMGKKIKAMLLEVAGNSALCYFFVSFFFYDTSKEGFMLTLVQTCGIFPFIAGFIPFLVYISVFEINAVVWLNTIEEIQIDNKYEL